MDGKKQLSLDAAAIKSINEKLVLNLIRDKQIISSTELVKITGMRPSTAFNITKELTNKGLISFLGKGGSSDKGGKKPYLWSLNKDAGFCIGMALKREITRFAVVNFAGECVAKYAVPATIIGNYSEFLRIAEKQIEIIIKENNFNPDKLMGIGVACAGIIDSVEKKVILSNILSDMNFSLPEKLHEKFNVPVFIENDANAVALGAKWIGEGKDQKKFVVVFADYENIFAGFGVGIIIDGKLYHGASFCAGELLPRLPQVKELLTGLKDRLTEGRILRELTTSVNDLSLKFFIEAAKQGDEVALMLFTKIGNAIGQIIAPAIAILNPERLIIFGEVADLDDIIIKPIRGAIEMSILSSANKALQICTSKLKNYAVAIGAASLVIEDYYCSE